jgi:serine/threonine-protein kinase
MPIFTKKFSKLVRIPEVAGISTQEASGLLSQNRLNYKIMDSTFHDSIPENHIARQRPPVGSMVKSDRTVYLTLSLGKKQIKIEELAGQSVRQAVHILENLQLVVGQLKYVESNKSVNMVIGTVPPAESMVSKGSSVDLLVSKGYLDQAVPVPDLTGLNLKNAREVLLKNRLNVGEIDYIKNPDLLPKTVISHAPDKDEKVNIGAKVNLVVTE